MEGEAGLGGGDSPGPTAVGGEAGIGVWLRGDGWEGFAVGLRGVLKGDLKGLERASVLSRRRRLRGGRADIVPGGGLWTTEDQWFSLLSQSISPANGPAYLRGCMNAAGAKFVGGTSRHLYRFRLDNFRVEYFHRDHDSCRLSIVWLKAGCTSIWNGH